MTIDKISQALVSSAVYSKKYDQRLMDDVSNKVKNHRFEFFNQKTGQIIDRQSALKLYQLGRYKPPDSMRTNYEDVNKMMDAAVALYLYGEDELSLFTYKQAVAMKFTIESHIEKMSGIERTIKSEIARASSSKRKKHKHYEEAIRIAKATWSAYPGASRAQLAQKLVERFKGSMSYETMDKWLRETRMQPKKTGKNISFSLVG